jgi:hypothetical protein
MRPIETIPGMREGGIKNYDGGGEINYDNKNFCKCHTLSLVQ